MLLEDNGLLPFLEDWHFFAEPKIQSNTVVAFFSPILLFSSFTIYTLIFNPYIHYIGSCTVHLNIRLDMAILSTKLEKGLSSVRAMNFVISRRCKTLLKWTNQKKKIQDKTVLDSGVHAGESRFQSSNSKAQEYGFHKKKFLNSRFDKQKFSGFWNSDYRWAINSPL